MSLSYFRGALRSNTLEIKKENSLLSILEEAKKFNTLLKMDLPRHEEKLNIYEALRGESYLWYFYQGVSDLVNSMIWMSEALKVIPNIDINAISELLTKINGYLPFKNYLNEATFNSLINNQTILQLRDNCFIKDSGEIIFSENLRCKIDNFDIHLFQPLFYNNNQYSHIDRIVRSREPILGAAYSLN